MLTLILKNLKNNKIYYFLILLGYVATIFTMSISASLIKISKDITIDFNQGDLNKQRIIEVNSDKNIDIDKIIEVTRKFSIDNAITISGISYRKVIDKYSDESWIVPVELVTFNEIPSWIPKVVEGQYFLPEQSKGNKKIAVVGTGVILNGIGNESQIDILGEKFNVIGSVGKIQDFSDYLGTVFLPINCLPNQLKNNIKTIKIKLYNDNGTIEQQKELLLNELRTNSELYVNEIDVLSNNEEYYSQLCRNGILTLLIWIIAIANISTLIYFMISKNRRNLVVSIAMGMSDRILIKQLFYTLMILSIFSSLIALIMQYMLIPLLKNNLTRVLNISQIRISSLNIIIVLVGIIIISLIIAILSVRSIYKEDLSKELKND
ncbi:ABC transporter permease [Clostridium taeniosporum]|uniref:ABC transporter permease n=1 Tax=Clostridium taeniosporum TaxID=394958 RepID=A0A1D7XM79_9CLOT|nr:ABC transporter permease [Clostridium taeniosporum]AOR24436.1 ABC transporter permease [Clostridium taeniosporum]